MDGPEFNSQGLQMIYIFVTPTEAFAASYWMGNRVGSWGNNSRGMKLTTNKQTTANEINKDWSYISIYPVWLDRRTDMIKLCCLLQFCELD